MNTGSFAYCRGCILSFALVPLAGASAHGMAYLPLVGPPPLRFDKAAVGAKKFSWTLPALTPLTTAITTNSLIATHSVSTNNPQLQPPAIQPSVAEVPVAPENLSTNSASQARPANDLLMVTPEMLVDYFKPNNDVTNAANVHVLVPVNFTPPASASVPSSQAIYKSQ